MLYTSDNHPTTWLQFPRATDQRKEKGKNSTQTSSYRRWRKVGSRPTKWSILQSTKNGLTFSPLAPQINILSRQQIKSLRTSRQTSLRDKYLDWKEEENASCSSTICTFKCFLSRYIFLHHFNIARYTKFYHRYLFDSIEVLLARMLHISTRSTVCWCLWVSDNLNSLKFRRKISQAS